jgi:DASS family divalent anion:Na+ symporter
MAAEIANVRLDWGMWALAALLPGIVSLLLIPLIVYKLYPPEIKRTPEAGAIAREELARMGPMSKGETVLLVVFIGILALWTTTQIHGIYATTVAFLGLSILLIFRVMRWEDVLQERGGWDALIWFGGLVMMAGQLNKLGLIKWFVDNVSGYVSAWPWLGALVILILVYLYAHYAFASMTAHVTAMYPAFLAVAVAAGAPAYLAALLFGYFSNLNASLTHYATGPAPIYFGSGYVDLPNWWTLGLLLSVVNVIVWIGIGFPYWKILGLW